METETITSAREFEFAGEEAWDASLDPDRVFFDLNDAAQAELKTFLDAQTMFKGMTGIKPIEAIAVDRAALPETAAEVARLEAQLKTGVRMAVVRPVRDISLEQQMAVPWVLGGLLGTLLEQNEIGDRAYIITDRGGKMEEGARYSQTNQGGSFHTDGVNLKSGYDYFLLSCIATAAEGGESILLNGFTILDRLQKESPETLDVLSRDLVWEYKGIFKDRFYHEPIVKIEEGVLTGRYLRNYIEEAARKTGEALSEESIAAMDRLDAVMDDPALQFHYSPKPGETAVINDKQIFHGRTAFRDLADAIPLEEFLSSGDRTQTVKRTYSRFWINK